ncbi:MAG: dihydrofolate reductase [Candidatus Diapherotrites archaeon]|uniref:Dihydrofolate reductase n=1 Tax=Candidatus Iainarchaeum sp. TaxID=3101447 RepID=A0A7J4J0M8_9ARCH|nr:MAG: dihydrofolate reductase [archaeon GW2011_AR10]MBS3059811.1 dihydrofolate reductase [Candidatus Diapherotrites archaeon]HIH08776.1 dihydrofolate reductase [Candidatus Diapherotrites archaeon]
MQNAVSMFNYLSVLPYNIEAKGVVLVESKPYYFAVAAITIDGFIARFPGHKADWTSKEDKTHLHKMEAKADLLLLARKTYEIAEKELSGKNCLVLTTKVGGIERKGKNLVYINPKKKDVQEFVEEKGYKKICVLGGRAAYTYALEKGLIDDLFITVEPIVFGKGIPMFDKEVELKRFRLKSVKKLNKQGTVLLHYGKNLFSKRFAKKGLRQNLFSKRFAKIA